MRLHHFEDEDEMPLVKKVSRESVTKILNVGKTTANPTEALKALMAGKLIKTVRGV